MEVIYARLGFCARASTVNLLAARESLRSISGYVRLLFVGGGQGGYKVKASEACECVVGPSLRLTQTPRCFSRKLLIFFFLPERRWVGVRTPSPRHRIFPPPFLEN